MCEDKDESVNETLVTPKTTNCPKDLDGIKNNDTIHIVLLVFHLCCYTPLNHTQNAKIMRKGVGSYMNHGANETGDVWYWIAISGFVT